VSRASARFPVALWSHPDRGDLPIADSEEKEGMKSSAGPLYTSFAAGAFALILPVAAALAAGGGGGGGSAGGGAGGGSGGADSSSKSANTPVIAENEEAQSYFAHAQKAIAQSQFYVAIDDLQKALDKVPNNADALNLMGFSKRKTGHLDESLEYYNKALVQNPNHVGANEYLGELYLDMKDVQKAQERLAVLQKACGASCEEYLELKGKIEKFKLTQS
jgi:tetratricopeptide (TPR) repeat protein